MFNFENIAGTSWTRVIKYSQQEVATAAVGNDSKCIAFGRMTSCEGAFASYKRMREQLFLDQPKLSSERPMLEIITDKSLGVWRQMDY